MTVYTCSLGDTSPLPPAPEDGDRVAFVDGDMEANGWTLVRVPQSQNPRLACRRLKTAPHLLFPGRKTLWVDASYHVSAPVEAIALFARGAEFAAFRHASRRNCYEEARRVMQRQLSAPAAVKGMMRRFEEDGFHSDTLTCGGFIYRRPTQLVADHAEEWWSQISQCSWRDQLSVDYAAWKSGMPIYYFPGVPSRNCFADYHPYEQGWKSQGLMPANTPLEDDWLDRVLKILQ
jgi:hypothetical protein